MVAARPTLAKTKKMPTAVMMIGTTSGSSKIMWISRMMRHFDWLIA